MLQLLREKKTSALGFFIIGFCALLMVPFGLDMIQENRGQDIAIEVGGREISNQEFERSVYRWENAFRQQLGDNYNQVAGMLNLRQRALDELVNGALLEQLSSRLGMGVGTEQIKEEIAAHPFFQGPITKAGYEAFLRAQGINGVQLEQMTRQQIIGKQLESLLANANLLTRPELMSAYRRNNRKASFSYIAFTPEHFKSKVDTSNSEELNAFYENNKERYKLQRGVEFEYALIPDSLFLEQVGVSEEDIVETYEMKKASFVEPKKVHLRKMVFNKGAGSALENLVVGEKNEDADSASSTLSQSDIAKQTAEKALERLKNGEKFEQVAKELSQDKITAEQGGDIGWLTYDDLDASIRNKAAELEIDTPSEIIESDDKFTIIQAIAKQESKQKPIEQVRGDIERAIKAERAPIYARAAADEFYVSAESSSGTPLAKLAEGTSYAVRESGRILRRGETEKSLPVQVVNKVVDLPLGAIDLITLDGASYVARITNVQEPSIPPFEDIKARVVEDYRTERAITLAREAAEKADKEAPLAKIAEETGLSVETTESSTIAAANGPLFVSPDSKQQLFALSPEKARTEEPITLGAGHYIVELLNEELPKEDEFEKQIATLMSEEQKKAGNRMTSILLEKLNRDANVWVDPELLNSRSL
jgi:peptidyl-prolyl cis-trans isomerase D